MGGNLIHYAVVFICYISLGYSVPIDYCLKPLNKSDCNFKPTQVFSYYKPASRCEVEIWRGCPTENMFNDEFLCSHYCIGKLWDHGTEEESQEFVVKAKDECHQTLNQSDCGVTETYKYTFKEGVCVRVLWKGCISHNMFDDEQICKAMCDLNPVTINWEHKIEELSIEDINTIAIILDNVIADEAKTNNESSIESMNLIVPETTEHKEESTEPPTTTEPAVDTTSSTTEVTETTVTETTVTETTVTDTTVTTPAPDITTTITTEADDLGLADEVVVAKL